VPYSYCYIRYLDIYRKLDFITKFTVIAIHKASSIARIVKYSLLYLDYN